MGKALLLRPNDYRQVIFLRFLDEMVLLPWVMQSYSHPLLRLSKVTRGRDQI
jgi:hypothetical protein